VYGHFGFFLFQFFPFQDRASIPRPSLESSHKITTGSFATQLARRSRARHFHTRVWYFHAGLTPPRARTSTTTNIDNNSSAASPPAAVAFLVDELATLTAVSSDENAFDGQTPARRASWRQASERGVRRLRCGSAIGGYGDAGKVRTGM